MSSDWRYIARETWGNLTPQQQDGILLAQFEAERRRERQRKDDKDPMYKAVKFRLTEPRKKAVGRRQAVKFSRQTPFCCFEKGAR